MTRQIPLPLPHREAMEANDYVITASNKEAAAWVEAWPNWSSHCLLVLGPSGSGKTHLLNLWLQKTGGNPIAAKDLATADAGDLLAAGNIIAVDNVDEVAGLTEAETCLLHLYNALKENKGSLLLTASVPPAQWKPGLADWRSRLLASPVASIGEPDDELMNMLLIKQFHDRQISVSADVVSYLLPRIERSSLAVRQLVDTLDRAALAENRAVTIALARKCLEKTP